jgi:hypothetical protein
LIITKGKITTQIEGAGLNYLKIYAEKQPVVKVNNKLVKVDYNSDLKLASIGLKLKSGEFPLVIIK